MAMTLSLTLTANGETIEGESTIASSDREDTIECFSFSYGVASPMESFSGQPAGFSAYAPIVVTKQIDKSTPFLWKALTLNENIEATFRFFRPEPGSGFTEHFYTIVITDGRVSAIDFQSPDSMDAVVGGHPPRETISFVYNNMIQTHEVSSVEHQDSFRDRE